MESARNSECSNHLRQIGVGFQNFESAKGGLPAGYLSQYQADGTDTGPGWGWGAILLDRLEEQPLQGQIQWDQPIEAAVNSTCRTTLVSLYLCPSDNVVPLWPAYRDVGTIDPQQKICDLASANYVAMFGNAEPGIDGPGVILSQQPRPISRSH